MRFFITEKKLAAIAATQLKESTERREKRDAEREARDVKTAQARVEQDRQLKEMKDFRDVGKAFLYLNYTMTVLRFKLMGNAVSFFGEYIPSEVIAICEYRHENGDLMRKAFPYEQLPVMKGGK